MIPAAQEPIVRRQAAMLVPAIIIMFAASTLNPKQIRRASLVIFLSGIALMALILFLGPEIKGAKRWLELGPFSLQPSEFVKPAFIVLTAWLFNEAQKRRCLPKLASAEWIAGAFALSEPQAGSDPAAMTTRATRKGAGWMLDGAKQWITSGDVAGVMVVWAKTDPSAGARGITAFLVEQGTPGVHAGRHESKLGIRASTTVPLTFDGCEVPDEARLGAVGEGFRIALSALDGGRIGIASQATGTIRAALDASTAYAKERKAFGVPIAQHQAIAFKLADMATDHAAARLLTLRAAAAKAEGRPFTREASMAKLFASEAAQRAVGNAIQIHGGYGYTEDYAVERYYRDARVQTIYEGTSEIQRLVIARELLRG